MKRPVVWAADATRDALDILRHIAEDYPDVAERIVDLIEAAGTSLGEIPTGRTGAGLRHIREVTRAPALDPLLRRR